MTGKINFKYILITAIAVFLSWILHEFAHWATGSFLGYEMGMSLNKGFLISGRYAKDSDYQLISAAGPLFTLIQALIFFVLMLNKKRLFLYPFLFTCFYMRLFATVISIRRPNDEARISQWLDIGKFTLPIIMTVILFFLIYKISKQYSLNIKFNLLNLGLVIFFSSIIIMSDQFFHIRLL